MGTMHAETEAQRKRNRREHIQTQVAAWVTCCSWSDLGRWLAAYMICNSWK